MSGSILIDLLTAQQMIDLHERLGSQRYEFWLFKRGQGLSEESLKKYDWALGKFEEFLKSLPGVNMDLTNFTHEEAQTWIGYSIESPGCLEASPHTIKFCEKVLVQYCDFASDTSRGIIDHNPLLGWDRYKAESPSLKVVPIDDVWAMLEEPRGSLRGKICVHLIVFEGLCPKEIVCIRRSDLLDRRGEVRPVILAKKRIGCEWVERRARLSSDVMGLLEKFLNSSKSREHNSIWLFPGRNRGIHISRSSLYYWVNGLARESGVPGVTARKLRNTGLVYSRFGIDQEWASKRFDQVAERFGCNPSEDLDRCMVSAKPEVYKPSEQASLDRFVSKSRIKRKEVVRQTPKSDINLLTLTSG